MEATPIPETAHAGRLRIGDVEIPCYVLEDGRRVITKAGICQVLGYTDAELDALCDQLGLPRFRATEETP